VKQLRLIGAFLVIGLLSYAAGNSLGPLPPLRPLLDPWVGAWQLARAGEPAAQLNESLPGLSAPVEIRIDHRGVPHVFASSEADAWRAQGWLVARDRLFQMNLQTRATAGRLTEWVGARALEADRRSRQSGLARTADRQWDALAADDPSRLAFEAYAEGVNAWIGAMGAADLPLEYRLLGVHPDRWEPKHTMYLFQQMATVLAAQDATVPRDRLVALVGDAVADVLLPIHSPVQEPIQPNGQFAPRIDPLRLPPPPVVAPGDSVVAIGGSSRGGNRAAGGDAIGSNNWAVSAQRSASGHALLAGDPHLGLTLPSIWYEVHLVVPGVLDVAGATMSGVPGVLIGFTRSLAWSVTNTGADVLDLYRETVDNPAAPTQYRLDGEWRPLELRQEEYRDGAGTLLATDTVPYTHRGPMARQGSEWRSTRWVMQESVADPHAWLRLNRATDIAAAFTATERFVGPAQNFIMADSTGAIAIRSTGFYPLRPGDGRGDVVRDGSLSANDWTGWLPVERYPASSRPAQGFLASANQDPIDPRASDAYLGTDWPTPWRAIRINTLLRADSSVTPEAMQRFQTDPGSAAAELFMPYLQHAVAIGTQRDSGRTALARAGRLLGEWDHRYSLENRRAVLFEQILGGVGREVWDELIPTGDSLPMLQPGQDVLAALLLDSVSPWWDDRRTTAVEDRDAVLARAIERGLAHTIERYGEPDDPRWSWGQIRTTNIHHLLRLAPLSRLGIPAASGTGTLSPSAGGGTHGASWRMVVELGPRLTARTTFPGGQSGNPFSRWYADRVPLWAVGDLTEALLPEAPTTLEGQALVSTITLVPGARP